MISSEGEHAEKGSEELKRYYCEKAELYLLSSRAIQAWNLLQEASTMYAADDRMMTLMDQCETQHRASQRYRSLGYPVRKR